MATLPQADFCRIIFLTENKRKLRQLLKMLVWATPGVRGGEGGRHRRQLLRSRRRRRRRGVGVGVAPTYKKVYLRSESKVSFTVPLNNPLNHHHVQTRKAFIFHTLYSSSPWLCFPTHQSVLFFFVIFQLQLLMGFHQLKKNNRSSFVSRTVVFLTLCPLAIL